MFPLFISETGNFMKMKLGTFNYGTEKDEKIALLSDLSRDSFLGNQKQ